MNIAVEGLTHPDSWDDPDPCDPYRRKQLSPSSAEYQAVLKNIQQTAGSSVKQIIKVTYAAALVLNKRIDKQRTLVTCVIDKR